MKNNKSLPVANKYSSFAISLTILGVLAFLGQALVYMRTSKGMLDEGLYLVKGWLFASQQFTPFQDYGPLTNHMPLAFLVPGQLLKWFGANLVVGRAYAVVLGVAGLLAVYFVTQRLAGKWWAVVVVWGLALNVALVRIYSLALSQVLVGSLLAFVLLASLRRDLNRRHAFLGGLLCGVLLMVRINMFPFVLLWLIYIWVRNRRAFFSGVVGAFAVVALVHFLYWPNILRMWAYWVPEGLFPLLEPFYTPWDKYSGTQLTMDLSWLGNLDDARWNSIISFWLAYRYNFVSMTAILLNLLFWPKKSAWPDAFTFHTAIFLNAAYLSLTFVHMWAALGGQSCHEFCFSGYMTFFNSLGLIALAVCAPHWQKGLHVWRALFALAILLVFWMGLGFGTANLTGGALADLPIPRLDGESFPLWGVFSNKWAVSYRDSRKFIPAIAGLGLGLLVLVVLVVLRSYRPKDDWARKPLALNLALVLLTSGFLLAPTKLMSGGDETLQCGGNIFTAYEELAAQLRQFVRPGDRLYYHGPNSPAILLYLPGVEFFPQQLNGTFSFNDVDLDADPDELLRFGYWNQEIKEQWLLQADWILIEARRFSEWEALSAQREWDTVLVSAPVEVCTGEGSRQILLKTNN